MNVKSKCVSLVSLVFAAAIIGAGCSRQAASGPTSSPIVAPIRTRELRATPAKSPTEAVATQAATSESPPGPVATETMPVPSPTATSQAEVMPEMAKVDSIEINIMESLPVKVSVLVRGSFPDGCTRLRSVSQATDGRTIILRLLTERTTEEDCTQALVPFEETLEVDVTDLATGTYDLDVNGITGTFLLTSVEPRPTEGEAEYSYEGWTLHEMDDLGVRLYAPPDWVIVLGSGDYSPAPLGSDEPYLLMFDLIADVPEDVQADMDALAGFFARRLRDQGESGFLVRSIVYGGLDGIEFFRRAAICSEAYIPAYGRVIRITLAASGCDAEGEIAVAEYEAIAASVEFYEPR